MKEFERLFGSLFEDAKPYIELIRTIAGYRYGIGQAELIAKSKLPDGGNTVRTQKINSHLNCVKAVDKSTIVNGIVLTQYNAVYDRPKALAQGLERGSLIAHKG